MSFYDPVLSKLYKPDGIQCSLQTIQGDIKKISRDNNTITKGTVSKHLFFHLTKRLHCPQMSCWDGCRVHRELQRVKVWRCEEDPLETDHPYSPQGHSQCTDAAALTRGRKQIQTSAVMSHVREGQRVEVTVFPVSCHSPVCSVCAVKAEGNTCEGIRQAEERKAADAIKIRIAWWIIRLQGCIRRSWQIYCFSLSAAHSAGTAALTPQSFPPPPTPLRHKHTTFPPTATLYRRIDFFGRKQVELLTLRANFHYSEVCCVFVSSYSVRRERDKREGERDCVRNPARALVEHMNNTKISKVMLAPSFFFGPASLCHQMNQCQDQTDLHTCSKKQYTFIQSPNSRGDNSLHAKGGKLKVLIRENLLKHKRSDSHNNHKLWNASGWLTLPGI